MLIWAEIKSDLEQLSRMPEGAQVGREQFPYAGLGGVFWLNAGLALENLLKGLAIQYEPILADDGKLARRLRTHNLLRLSEFATIRLSVSEAFYLSIATECVIWEGRYPAPTTGRKPESSVFSEGDVLTYRGLFDSLARQIDSDNGRTITYERLA